MKSERRHELQTNYLADHLGTAVESSRPFAIWVVIGIAAAVVVAVGYGLYSAQAARASASAWGDYYFNIGTGDAEAFQQIGKDHPQTTAAQWGLQSWADNQLMVGLDQLYTNRKEAEASIEQAIEGYQQIIKQTYEPELSMRASLGLGQAYEALGKLDDAVKAYEGVAGGGSIGFARMAAQRIKFIKSGEGKAFYDWFATVRSKPATPPNIPTDLSKPPTEPNISFPDPASQPSAPVGDLPTAQPVKPAEGDGAKAADPAVPATPASPAAPADGKDAAQPTEAAPGNPPPLPPK